MGSTQYIKNHSQVWMSKRDKLNKYLLQLEIKLLKS